MSLKRNLLFDVDNTIKRDVLNSKEVARKIREQTNKTVVKKMKDSNDPALYREKVNAIVTEYKARHPEIARGKDWPNTFIIVDNEFMLEELCESLTRSKAFAYDTETMGLKIWHHDYLVGFSFYTPVDGRAWYVPLKHIECIEKPIQLNYCKVKRSIKAVMDEKLERSRANRKRFNKLSDIDFETDYTEGVVTFNGKFDAHVMWINMGITMPDIIHEGYIASKVLNENFEPARLKPLCNHHLEKYKKDPCDTFDETFEKIPCAYFPVWMVGYYACKDALLHWEWMEFSRMHIRQREGLAESYYVVQLPVIPSVIDSEQLGIRFDTELAKQLDVEFTDIAKKIEITIKKELQGYVNSTLDENPNRNQFAVYGKNDKVTIYDRNALRTTLINELNIGSPDQLAKLFYDIFGWTSGSKDKKTKKPSRSTNEETMKKLAKNYPVAGTILELRTLNKLLGTYIRGLPEEISPWDNKIHTSFNSFGAKTGRFSSADPNLQNIPARPKTFIIDGKPVKFHFGERIRQLFIAEVGHKLVSTDYSQIEPRITAVMSGCHVMLEAYRTTGRDIYSEMAKIFFPGFEVWEYYDNDQKHYKSKQRADVKAIVLGERELGPSKTHLKTRNPAA